MATTTSTPTRRGDVPTVDWDQARRTALTDATTTALFILDALDPLTDKALT